MDIHMLSIYITNFLRKRINQIRQKLLVTTYFHRISLLQLAEWLNMEFLKS